MRHRAAGVTRGRFLSHTSVRTGGTKKPSPLSHLLRRREAPPKKAGLEGRFFVTGAPRNRDCVGRGGAKPAPEPSRSRGGEVKRLSRRRKEPSLCNAGSRPPNTGQPRPASPISNIFCKDMCLAKNPSCRANVRPWACAAARQQGPPLEFRRIRGVAPHSPRRAKKGTRLRWVPFFVSRGFF